MANPTPSPPLPQLPRRRPDHWALLVLIVVFSLSVFSALFARHLVQLQQQARFTREVDALSQSISQRLEEYLGVLRATRGLWNVSRSVSRDTFARYVDALNLPRHYPGIQGLGYAALVEGARLGVFQSELRAQGAATYRVFPPGAHPVYLPVAYLEPRNAANQYALGFDMLSEPTRRAAAERAIAGGDLAASAPVRLLQEDLKAERQQGFLLYLPLYAVDARTDTPDQRRAVARGVVYASFRFGDFLSGLGAADQYGAVALSVRDGAQALYGRRAAPAAFEDRRSLMVGGRTWTLAFRAGPQFGADTLQLAPALILLLGTLVALSLFWGTLRQVRARERAEELAGNLSASRASLSASRAEFEAVFRSMRDIAVFADRAGRVRLANAALAGTFGYQPAELLGRDLASLYAEGPADLAGAGPHAAAYRRKDGSRFVGEAQRSPVHDGAGEVIGQLEVVRDLTERLESGRALRESELRYRGLIEGLPQVVWLADAAGRPSYFNRRWAEYVGEARAPGGFSPEVVHPADWARFETAWGHALAGGAPLTGEFRLRGAAGAYRTFALHATPLRAEGNGKLIEWIGTAADVEDRAHAEASARLLADVGRLTTAPLGEARDLTGVLGLLTQDMVSSATLWLDVNGQMRRFHAAQSGAVSDLLEAHAEGALILARSAMASRTVQVVGPTPGLQAAGLARVMALPLMTRDEEPLGALLLGYRQVPEPRDVQVAWEVVSRMTTVLDNQRLFVQARDAERVVKELNQSLEARVQTRTRELLEANQELEAFSYSVSHDLRTPLRHIVGFGDLLRKETGGQLGDKAERYLDIITNAATRMSALIDDLLGFSRMGRQEMRLSPVDLNATVREVRDELMHEYQARQVEWRLGELPTVLGDAGLLKLVFTNLLANALKYSRKREHSRIALSAHAEGGEAIIEVRDNGVGFDSRFTDKLFGVFQRLHRSEEFEGTGIGLANVRRIVGRHGGRVWAESELGSGASFFVALPLAQRPLEERGAVSGGTP